MITIPITMMTMIITAIIAPITIPVPLLPSLPVTSCCAGKTTQNIYCHSTNIW